MSPDRARQRGLTSTVCFPRGNLAPEGAVIKSTAIDPAVLDADGVYRKTGPAHVFYSEREAVAAIKGQTDRPVRPGDVLVLCGRGPLGSGMEETYQITSALRYLSWGREVAVITDARFSGVSTGACIGHVGPEALAGGPIGKLRDGDLIRIVIDPRQLTGSIDFVGQHRVPLPKPSPLVGEGRSPQRLDAARSGNSAALCDSRTQQPRNAAATRRRSTLARRHPAVGRFATRQRRHLGRLRLRCRSDHRVARGRRKSLCGIVRQRGGEDRN